MRATSHRRWIIRFVVLMLVVLAALSASAPSWAESPAARAAVARARQLRLAERHDWRRLLLYRRLPSGRWTSDVTGSSFFLAKDGRSDPALELDATLDAFFEPAVAGREDEHALCMFPARRIWLEAHLHFAGDLPSVRCPALEKYVTEMDAEAVVFVFAANHVENPASAFGHTILRIRKRGSRSAEEADRRDHGVDYTARVDTKNPFLYALKGIAGLFPGLFRFLPYDKMLLEYGASESRDLWEYELALSPKEVELLVVHLFELSNSELDYYYLTENCSYQILAAIDAAVPRIHLVEDVKKVVLPLDTAKAVTDAPGLVANVVYRPSVTSLFHAALDELDGRSRDLVAALIDDPDAPLPPDLAPAQAALVLETTKLALEARHATGLVDGTAKQAGRTIERISARRATIALGPVVPPLLRRPDDKQPPKSHGSMRIMLGTGMTSQYETGFATLGFRLALHDLADPPDGEPELLQLQFLDTRLRYDHGRRDVTLDRLTFAEVMNLRRITRFEKKLSWRIRAFGDRLHDRAAPDTFFHGLGTSLGATFGTEDDHVVFFLMADAYVGFSGGLDGIGGSFVRAGVGPLAGLRMRLPASTVGVVTATGSYLPAQSLAVTWDLRASLRTRLAKNVAMGFEGVGQPRAFELSFASFLYF